MPRDELRHRAHVARLRAAAPKNVLEVRGRHLQRAADPLAGRESRSTCGRVRRWMRASVHEDRPVQRPHELDVVDADIARQRVLLLENPRPRGRATGAARRAAGTGLTFPDRLRRRVRSDAARVVEGNPRVVTQRRLPEGVPLVVVQRHSWAMSGGAGCRPGRRHRVGEHQFACGQRDGKEPSSLGSWALFMSGISVRSRIFERTA